MLKKLCNEHILSESEAYTLFLDLASNNLSEFQISTMIGIYQTRHISVSELAGFKNALLEKCIPLHLEKKGIDVCGTGGDKKNTFNISTISAFVLAASDIPITKHGNFGASSISGSSDILKFFGHEFKINESDLNSDLDKHNICFIHAPLFHRGLQKAGAVRKNLKLATFFNLLGPLVNPAQPAYRYIGTFNCKVARMYNYILQDANINYTVVHSVDGYDEISLTGESKIYTNLGETLMDHSDFGFVKLNSQELHAGHSLDSAANIFLNVLQNKATAAQKNVVLANSALAYRCYHPTLSIQQCLEIVNESIESQKAYHLFKKIIQ